MGFFSFLKYTFIIFAAHQCDVAHRLSITGLDTVNRGNFVITWGDFVTHAISFYFTSSRHNSGVTVVHVVTKRPKITHEHHVKWVPCHHCMASPWVAVDADGLQICESICEYIGQSVADDRKRVALRFGGLDVGSRCEGFVLRILYKGNARIPGTVLDIFGRWVVNLRFLLPECYLGVYQS
jgi:hypothetical protein